MSTCDALSGSNCRRPGRSSTSLCTVSIRIGSIGTRTTHGFAFLVRMLGPKLYDTCSSKAIIKPGKDAIVSITVPEILLNGAGIDALVGEVKATRMAEHMR